MKAYEKYDDTSPHGLVEARVSGGYHSFHLMDCTSYTFSLCEKCLRSLFDGFAVPPFVRDSNGWTDEDGGPHTYTRDREAYEDRLWVESGSMKENYLAGLCTATKKCNKVARWTFLDEPKDAFDLYARDAVCDDHVPWEVNAVGRRAVPSWLVPKQEITLERLRALQNAWKEAPDQFPELSLTEAYMTEECKRMVGDQWETWSKKVIPTMNESSPEKLIEEGHAAWLYKVLKVFAQRNEIPYLT